MRTSLSGNNCVLGLEFLFMAVLLGINCLGFAQEKSTVDVTAKPSLSELEKIVVEFFRCVKEDRVEKAMEFLFMPEVDEDFRDGVEKNLLRLSEVSRKNARVHFFEEMSEGDVAMVVTGIENENGSYGPGVFPSFFRRENGKWQLVFGIFEDDLRNQFEDRKAMLETFDKFIGAFRTKRKSFQADWKLSAKNSQSLVRDRISEDAGQTKSNDEDPSSINLGLVGDPLAEGEYLTTKSYAKTKSGKSRLVLRWKSKKVPKGWIQTWSYHSLAVQKKKKCVWKLDSIIENKWRESFDDQASISALHAYDEANKTAIVRVTYGKKLDKATTVAAYRWIEISLSSGGTIRTVSEGYFLPPELESNQSRVFERGLD